MQKYKVLFINGQAFNYHHGMSLQEILVYLNFNLSNIIVEHNKEVITSNDFNNLFLSNLDRIEVITIVGGG
uniref:Thiamin biosynthesis protein S n=1 Tax=Pleonosporium borreri TaxID=2575635 RepID=A0A4D6WVU8_9FLOR|nr:Thiamin biosynthesis protein S [Pleonosporium borreri]